ncbi:MAG: response regulator [Clostridium sp.]|nr:response regulator [Clostridium sp.]
MYSVLIADDDPLMRNALEVMIRKIDGFKVQFSVNNGEEAIELCKDNKIDIIFMDIMMPGKSGIECSKRIYEINSSAVIFIVSSYNSFDFAIEALNTKVKAYLSKPVSFLQIEKLLDEFKKQHDNESKLDSYKKYMNILYSIIEEKNFRKVYYEVPKIVNEIYSAIDEKSDSNKIFKNIGQQLINSTKFIDEKNEDVNEIFPLNRNVLNEEKYLEFWVFNIMNYVFKKNSIKKYKLLEDVFKYIDLNIKEEIGLNEIISNCMVSQGYLSRIFKREFGVSVMEYLHMLKISIAKSYFCFTNMSITDIAFDLGYNESSYFSKVFKKYENITVYQYKKMI